MEFTIKCEAQGGGDARLGELSTKSGVIETPAFLLYTERGAATHLTRDNVELAAPNLQGIQLPLCNM